MIQSRPQNAARLSAFKRAACLLTCLISQYEFKNLNLAVGQIVPIEGENYVTRSLIVEVSSEIVLAVAAVTGNVLKE